MDALFGLTRDDETVESVITKLIVEKYGVSESTIKMIIQMFLLPLLKSLKKLPKPDLPENAPVDLEAVYAKKEWCDREKLRIFWWASMHGCVDILKYLHERFPALADNPGIYNEQEKLNELLTRADFEVLQCLHDVYCLTSDDFTKFANVLIDGICREKYEYVEGLVKLFGYPYHVEYEPMETAIMTYEYKMIEILWGNKTGLDKDHTELKKWMVSTAETSMNEEVVNFVKDLIS